MEELFLSDKHRGDLLFTAVMAQLTEVRLEIDFNANNSELTYCDKVQTILETAGGEDVF